MPIYRLSTDHLQFPPPELADNNGMLAVGGDLSPERLLLAYRQGIFPWFNPEDPIVWWSPDPRFVLYPDDLKVHKSMRPYFNQQKFRVTYDQNFETVMRHCQEARRKGQYGGTWITESMLEAYVNLHELGYAHSVEVWEREILVGGLYGLALGKVFFGESMFAKASNASKFGFISLVQGLTKEGYNLIDCQQQTKHLASLGAKAISRKLFMETLRQNEMEVWTKGKWSANYPSLYSSDEKS
ncbi:MAG: leucyl/phenylalanyl-tRNA--protein transferase [Polaribacter sp.]